VDVEGKEANLAYGTYSLEHTREGAGGGKKRQREGSGKVYTGNRREEETELAYGTCLL